MSGFQGYADLDLALRNGQTDDFWFSKLGIGSGKEAWQSMWNIYTGVPAAGSQPSSGGTSYSGPTTGAMTFNDVSPKTRFLKRIRFVVANNNGCPVMLLYDRLCAVSGLVGNVAGVQALTLPALPRYTSGNGVQAWVEVTSGAQQNWTLNLNSYTNQSGVAGQVGASTPFVKTTGANTGTSFPLNLQDGSTDSGVQSVASINVTAAAASSLTFNLVLLKPIAFIMTPSPVANQADLQYANVVIERDFIMDLTALPRIYDGANLAMMCWVVQDNTNPQPMGSIETVYN